MRQWSARMLRADMVEGIQKKNTSRCSGKRYSAGCRTKSACARAPTRTSMRKRLKPCESSRWRSSQEERMCEGALAHEIEKMRCANCCWSWFACFLYFLLLIDFFLFCSQIYVFQIQKTWCSMILTMRFFFEISLWKSTNRLCQIQLLLMRYDWRSFMYFFTFCPLPIVICNRFL